MRFDTRVMIVLTLMQGYSLAAAGQVPRYAVGASNTFSSISNYSEGLARVSIAYDSTGFIDTAGRPAFSATFPYAGNFHSGRAFVRKTVDGKTKFGFIDRAARVVIPCIYDKVADFSSSRAAVSLDGVWKIIDTGGRTVMDDSVLVTETRLTDASSGTDAWEDTEPPAYSDGLMQVRSGKKYGYADTSGKIVIPYRFFSCSPFHDGVALAAADTVDGSAKYQGTGILEKLYNSLPPGPPTYRWQLIDTLGRTVFRFPETLSPDLSRTFHDGMLPVRDSLDRWGFINREGRIVMRPVFATEPTDFSDGVCLVQVNGHRNGNTDGYLLVIDTTGRQLSRIPFCQAAGCMYDSNLAFHEGLMAVRIGRSWGYMDIHGSLVIPPVFDKALDFHCRRAVVVTSEGKVAVIVNPLKDPRP
jgi:hypothetical protein